MPRKKTVEIIQQPYDIGNGATVIVRYRADARPPMFHNDTQVIVGAAPGGQPYVSPFANEPVVRPADTPQLAAAREALRSRHPEGPSGSGAITPADMGFPPLTPESLSGAGFAGPSNEEVE